MTEVRQGPTPRVRFNEVSVKRELTVHGYEDVLFLFSLSLSLSSSLSASLPLCLSASLSASFSPSLPPSLPPPLSLSRSKSSCRRSYSAHYRNEEIQFAQAVIGYSVIQI